MAAATIAATSSLKPIFLGRHYRPNLMAFRCLGPSIPLSRLFAASARSRDHRRQPATGSSGERITAQPSSELRRKNTGGIGGSEEEKLRSLRELFSRPGIGIDAYIIPSQDAHQVRVSHPIGLRWFVSYILLNRVGVHKTSRRNVIVKRVICISKLCY